jgi:hypothetical protein
MTTYDFNAINLFASSIFTVGALTYPAVDGTANAVLQTNGAGVLSLVTNNYVVGPSSAVANQVATYNGTSGKLIEASTATISPTGAAVFSGLVNGALTYPSVDSTAGFIMQTNGAGIISFVNPSATQDISQIFAELTTSYTSNVAAGDHIKFTTAGFTIGSDITIDLTTTYTNVAAVASLGRITVAGGKAYLLEGRITSFIESSHLGTMTLQWFNSDANTAIGNPLTYSGDGALAPQICFPDLKAYFNPPASPATVRVELRITANTGITTFVRGDVTCKFV